VRIYTIGFTKKSASQFFETLRTAGVARVVDVRLNNASQLAGFSKKQDLPYFLEKICAIRYTHVPLLAPTPQILNAYKKHAGGWDEYERAFLQLMNERRVEDTWAAQDLRDADCLLCSEEKPDHCHRRLVAEYLASHRDDLEIHHLG
jgi:uncharacterized protein (DUF488 family)